MSKHISHAVAAVTLSLVGAAAFAEIAHAAPAPTGPEVPAPYSEYNEDADTGDTGAEDPDEDPAPSWRGACGAKPANAPSFCGAQQWTQYSSHLPVAVPWLNIANVGTASCSVTVTKLELTYSKPSGSGTLSTGISGAQRLSDGTGSATWWGKYITDTTLGPTYTVPAGTGYFVHPFGARAVVPTDATKLTVRYALDVGPGCVVQAGLDTYHKDTNPTAASPYTQNGATTDFIKEAYKTPWYATSIAATSPAQFSITHHAAPTLRMDACYRDAKVTITKPSDATPDATHPTKVFRRTTSMAPSAFDVDVPAATPWKTTTTSPVTDAGLTLGTSYYYAAFGTGVWTYAPTDDLHSALGAQVKVVPANVPWTAPTVTGTGVRGQALVSWTSASQRQTGCAALIQSYQVWKANATSTGACPSATSTSWTLAVATDPIDMNGSAEATTQKSLLGGGLTSGQKVCFKVAGKLSTGTTTNQSGSSVAFTVP